MKALMIFGALVGFLIGCGPALAGQCPWPTALWRASAAALVAGVLTRWWSGVWIDGLKESLLQRRNARPAAPNNSKTAAKS
jgi:hypothetical protein